MRKILFPIIFILLFISTSQLYSGKMRIAIYDFNAKGVSKNTAERVTDWIRISMAGGNFAIVERTQMDKIFKEHEFSMSGCTDSDCAVQIGKMLSANRVLVGTVEKFGSKYIITGRLVDVEKGVAEFGHKEKIKDYDELDSCAEQFALNMIKNINKSIAEKYKPVILMKTSMGNIKIELFMAKAPITVKNFLRYVDMDFYNGTIFHRVIPNFMIQGGGFTSGLKKKYAYGPIKNEAANGLSNTRGTITMARTQVIDSASSQFFINVKKNLFLDHINNSQRGFGYCVFGRVIEGMDVVDKMKNVKTGNVGKLRDVPVKDVVILLIEKLK